MKKYLKHFLWLFILLAVLLVIYLIFNAGRKDEQQVVYTRTNTECLTEERVFDYADKLTPSEEESLRALIAECEEKIGCDIVLVTINETVPSMMEYADDFYDNNQYGYDEPWGDGAIYVDNWATGDVWFSTCGRVESAYSSSMIDRLIDKVCENVNDDPYGAYCTYVNTLYNDMSGNSSSEETATELAPLFALIATAIYLGVNLVHQKGKKTTVANTYVAGGRPDLRHKEDIFLHKHVSKRHIETSSGGGGGGGHHISGGGHSHGGGGGHH